MALQALSGNLIGPGLSRPIFCATQHLVGTNWPQNAHSLFTGWLAQRKNSHARIAELVAGGSGQTPRITEVESYETAPRRLRGRLRPARVRRRDRTARRAGTEFRARHQA